jgi:hypothetical protein
MGKTPGPPVLPEVRVTMTVNLRDRVNAAAKRMEQSAAAWVRLAIVEKLERDAR